MIPCAGCGEEADGARLTVSAHKSTEYPICVECAQEIFKRADACRLLIQKEQKVKVKPHAFGEFTELPMRLRVAGYNED